MNIEESAKCFASLYPEELIKIAEGKKQLQYAKGEQIFKQDAFAHHVFYIIDGLVKLSIQTGFDKQLNLKIATTGDFIAFNTIFDESIYNYTATTIRNSTICMIEKESLKKLLISNSEFAFQINSRNCKTEILLLEIIKNISYKQMRGKMASALLYINSIGSLQENVFPYLSRQDIAEFASVSTESAIKILKEFEQETIIELKNKDIIIREMEKLEDVSKRS